MGNQQQRVRGIKMNLLEKRLKEKYPNEKFEVLNYTRMKDKATVKCLKCGNIYTQNAETFLRKNKTSFCQNCGVAEHFKNKYQEKINRKYPDEDILILEYNGTKGKLKVKCMKCGSIIDFSAGENILDSDKKRVCQHCFPNKREALQRSIKRFHSFVNENTLFTNFVFPDNLNSNSLVESTCIFCGKKNYKTMYDYMRGRGCSCQAQNEMLTNEQYQKRIGEEYELLSDYKGLNKDVLIRHKECGFVYKANAKHISCPKCKGSKGEKTIRYWLKQKEISYIEEYGVTIENHKLRFDFYLPDYNLFIEYYGEQHYRPIDYFCGQETYEKQVYYDTLKRRYAKDRLIEIKYNEDISLMLNEQVVKKSSNLVEDFSKEKKICS